MIVDIAKVNSIAPYKISVDEKSESFIFRTDNGFTYEVSFMRDDGLFEGLVVSRFSLYSPDWSTGERHIPDLKVRETVFEILKNFLARNNQAVVYVCNNDDGLQRHRFRLFIKWFFHVNDSFAEKFVIRPLEYSADGISLFAGMVLRLDNPLKEQYLEALNRYIQLLNEK